MTDSQLIGKDRRMKGTTQVMESGLLLLCPFSISLFSVAASSESASASLVAEVSDFTLEVLTKLRCRVKEIRTEGLSRVQKLMGLSYQRDFRNCISHTQRLVWGQHSVVIDHTLRIHLSES